MSGEQKVQTYRIPQENGVYVLLPIKGVLMVAAIALICSSKDILVAQPCELQIALESLNLSYTPPCEYNSIREKSNEFYTKGLTLLCLNGILFLIILLTYLWPSEFKTVGLLLKYVFVLIVAVILFAMTFILKNGFDDSRRTQSNVDYSRLQTEMLFSLEKHFTSDNTSSSDEISSNWNKFFLKYDCCAVREVQGSTNDFDNTPWCTTSGSCQDTSSQIPRTCCKDVTQDSYKNAPSSCYEELNHGTYRSSCISRIKSLSLRNINACQVWMLSFSLLSLVIFQMFEAIVAFVMVLVFWGDFIRNNRPSTGKTKKIRGD